MTTEVAMSRPSIDDSKERLALSGFEKGGWIADTTRVTEADEG